MRSKLHILVYFLLIVLSTAHAQIITTYAGNGTYGNSGNGGPATSAQLAEPFGLAADNTGNLYIADMMNNVIRKVNSAGIISIFAGTGALGYSGDGGPATSALLYHPLFLAVDNAGNLFFTDQNSDVLRKINTAGIISTINNTPAGYSGDGGPLALAQFTNIAGIYFDAAGNMYLSDYGNGTIRKVNTADVVSTIAGTGTLGFGGDGGPAIAAQLNHPYNVVVDAAGNVYIPDHLNRRIRKINTAGIISTYAGTGVAGYSGDGGPAAAAQLACPWHCDIDNAGNIYVADGCAEVVRKITSSGIISTYAGNGTSGYSGDGGPAINAQMIDVCGVAVDNVGNLYIVNRTWPNVVRKVSNCLSAVITQQPVDVNLCNTGNAVFSVTATNATSLQWQLNTGAGWNDLADDATYAGVNTSSLSITGVNTSMNNYQYRCKATNSCGPVYSVVGSLIVSTPIAPSITINATSVNICAGTPITFNAISINGGTVPAFQWYKNGLPVGTNNAVYTDNTFANADIVTCNITSNNLCASSNTATSNQVIITVNTPLTPVVSIAPSSNNICATTAVTFTASGTNGGSSPSYQWKKNGINVGTNSTIYTDNLLNNGDAISLIMTSSNSCVTSPAAQSNIVTMNVSALLTPSVLINASATHICSHTSVVFTAVPVNGGASPVYLWKKNGMSVGSNSNSYADNNPANGDIVNCIITSNSTCLAIPSATSNSINITVFSDPVVTLDHSATLCSGSSRQLDAGNFSSYLWNDGSSGRTLSVNNTGKYYVTVKDNNGCTGSDTSTIISVLPVPKDFLPPDTAICDYGSLTINPLPGYKNYLWNTNSTSQSITVTAPGEYWLQATGNNDCKGRDTIIVELKQCLKGFFVPTAFTPNNDGNNDLFMPMLFGVVKKYRFIIYNRWGHKVFESTDVRKGWDGMLQGTKQDNAVFAWICTYQLEGEQEKVQKGTVILIR
jgi:gliding motility-associated-like protein